MWGVFTDGEQDQIGPEGLRPTAFRASVMVTELD